MRIRRGAMLLGPVFARPDISPAGALYLLPSRSRGTVRLSHQTLVAKRSGSPLDSSSRILWKWGGGK